jgi:hypothetical protein
MRAITLFAVIGAIAGILLAASPAQATAWWELGLAGDRPTRVAVFADQASIRIMGDIRQGWTILIPEDQSIVGNIKELHEVDCPAKRWRTLKNISTDGHGDSGKMPVGEDGEWSTVEAGSMGDHIISFICGTALGTRRVGSPEIDAQFQFLKTK